MKYGFVNVAAAVPNVRVADVDYNLRETETLIAQAEADGVEIVCFPELGLTGYTCQDLFRSRTLLDRAQWALAELVLFSRDRDIISIVGVPLEVDNLLLNCAVVVQRGSVLGVCPRPSCPTTPSSTRSGGLPRCASCALPRSSCAVAVCSFPPNQ